MVCNTDTDNIPSILNQKQGSLTDITFKVRLVGQITSDMHIREGTHRAPNTSGSQLAGLAANQIPWHHDEIACWVSIALRLSNLICFTCAGRSAVRR